MRFFMYTLGDERVPIPPPTPGDMARMGAFMSEAVRAGVLLATGAFAPSQDGARKVTYRGGSCTVTDGPFTESKELIGGPRRQAASPGRIRGPSLPAAAQGRRARFRRGRPR